MVSLLCQRVLMSVLRQVRIYINFAEAHCDLSSEASRVSKRGDGRFVAHPRRPQIAVLAFRRVTTRVFSLGALCG